MIVGVVDGSGWVVGGQGFGWVLTVDVIEGATVGVEVGRLVDKCSGPGVSPGVGHVPESTAEVDLSEVVGI